LATAELRAYRADAPNKWRQIIFQGYCTRRLNMPTTAISVRFSIR
jgi:hypothetical protein